MRDKKPKSQLDKFREAARELETDDDEARFDEKLKRIAKSPPPSPDKGDTKNPAQSAGFFHGL